MNDQHSDSFSARHYIVIAFLDLLDKSPFDKISVSQIVKKAGISRSTFYLHFLDKYDLMDKLTEHITDEFLSHYQVYDKESVSAAPNQVQKTTLEICKHMMTYKSFYNQQLRNPVFIHYLSQQLFEQLVHVYRHKGYATFAGYGTIGYLTQWIHGGFELSPIEAATELSSIGLTNWSQYSFQRFNENDQI
ncbi:TetR family transcriptional regulator [Paenibacillus mendelii]|uniref:TetR/AcrR family transcriptional regulator n=1 Tax=Paenibacillus mendelii TaxID=206163 RepID=A0ABV6JKZ5_9BACL|nr:TetR/AcrR family transcriptional regulator [Paenibacillus mendelii]MCQ6560568.1 TetR/AcrR family transcriptional regulator [Paenibacillus mendelii]